jgi:hypothetical protein
VILSAANANDSTMFEAVLDDIPPIRMPSGAAAPAAWQGPWRQSR